MSATTEHAEVDWQALLDVALSVPGSVGQTYNRFYEYSFTNQMLLMMQGVCEPVATYKRWLEMGRQVQKGSKAHAILRPIITKRDKTDEDEKGRLIGFKAVRCLFGVSQTDGDALPPVELPAWDLNSALAALDVRQIPYDMLSGNVQGYSVARTFAVSPVAVHPTRTMFHELGHIMLGHTTEQVNDTGCLSRAESEFQAEACAYLVMNELGQASEDVAAHSRGYIQGWLKGKRPSDASVRAVFTATDKILKAGRATR